MIQELIKFYTYLIRKDDRILGSAHFLKVKCICNPQNINTTVDPWNTRAPVSPALRGRLSIEERSVVLDK